MKLERILLSLELPVPVSMLVAVQRGLETMPDYKPDSTFMRQEGQHLLIFEAVDTETKQQIPPATLNIHWGCGDIDNLIELVRKHQQGKSDAFISRTQMTIDNLLLIKSAVGPVSHTSVENR